MVLTAYNALSRATNSSCHRHRRINGVDARLGSCTSADLTPATGARTTRLCRPRTAFANRHRWHVHITEALAKSETAPFVHAPSDGSRTFPQWKARPAVPARDDAAASTASHAQRP